MGLERLKFKKLVYGAFVRTWETLFPIIRSLLEARFISKCVHLVYKMIKYALNKSLFLIKFFYMIGVYEKCQIFFFGF